MKRHSDTFMQLNELGTHYPTYQPTFEFVGDFINKIHSQLAANPTKGEQKLIQIRANRSWRSLLEMSTRDMLTQLRNVVRFGLAIPGWLTRDDALKLYEIAYFSCGDILELGSYHGFSTCILAQANHDRPVPNSVYTVDIEPSYTIATLQNLRKMQLAQGVTVICNDTIVAIRKFAADKKRFGCIFIDCSHRYDDVLAVCRELTNVVASGGFCLFHDFNSPYNRDEANDDYGVYQAVTGGLDPARFEFYGIYGCIGLYRAI